MRQKNPVPHFLIQGILIQCLDCSGVPFLLSVIQIAHVHFRLFSVQELVFWEWKICSCIQYDNAIDLDQGWVKPYSQHSFLTFYSECFCLYPLQWHVGNSDLLETVKQMICFSLPYFSITIIWIICLDVSVSGNLFPASHLFLVTVFSDVTPFSDFLPTPLSLDNVCPWHLFLLACFSLGVSFFCHPFLLTRDISVPSQLFLLASLSFGNSFSSHIFCFDILGKQVVAPWHSNATALSTGLQNTKKIVAVHRHTSQVTLAQQFRHKR